MTRAREELYLTTAWDYGGGKPRRISRFVLEALGLNQESVPVRRSGSLEIIRRSAGIMGVEIAPEASDLLAGRSRRTPRIGNRLLSRVRDYAVARASGVIDERVAEEALEVFEVDELGLDKVDRAILEAIVHRFGGGPVGLSTLAIAVGEEPETVEDAYEPFLLQSGLMKRTPRGRMATEHAYVHLGLDPPADPQGKLI
jgi:Holliday junction DNA helicase RuvB